MGSHSSCICLRGPIHGLRHLRAFVVDYQTGSNIHAKVTASNIDLFVKPSHPCGSCRWKRLGAARSEAGALGPALDKFLRSLWNMEGDSPKEIGSVHLPSSAIAKITKLRKRTRPEEYQKLLKVSAWS